jgi:hypothetical protein
MQEVGLPSHATRLMGAQKPQLWNRQRYDTKLWMRDLMEGAAYLPK